MNRRLKRRLAAVKAERLAGEARRSISELRALWAALDAIAATPKREAA